MKKIAAILLLGTLVFNWFGYQLLTDYLQYRADKKLEARLDDDDYDEAHLIELKVPVSLPYQTNWDDFERYNGEIEIDGVHYKYVKRKVYNDSLILLCLPNESKMQIENARENFFKLVNDLQTSESQKSNEKGNSVAFKKLLSEYCFTETEWTGSAPALLQKNYTVRNSLFLPLRIKEVSEKPPEC